MTTRDLMRLAIAVALPADATGETASHPVGSQPQAELVQRTSNTDKPKSVVRAIRHRQAID